MKRLTRLAALAAMAPLAGMLGCSSGHEEMKQPARPAELDRLDRWVGTWDTTATVKMRGSDETMTGTGTGTMAWDANRRAVVERFNYSMGDMGAMAGLGVWTWDAKAKKYRSTWVDDWGMIGQGTARYDEAKRQWKMKACSRNTIAGGKTVGRGTITEVDDRTQEWEFKEYVPCPLTGIPMMEVMSMKGTSKKK